LRELKKKDGTNSTGTPARGQRSKRQDTRHRQIHDSRQAAGTTAAFIEYPRPYACAAPGIHVDKLRLWLLSSAKPAKIRVISWQNIHRRWLEKIAWIPWEGWMDMAVAKPTRRVISGWRSLSFST